MNGYAFKLLLTVVSVSMFSAEDKAGKKAMIFAVIGSALSFTGEYYMLGRTSDAFYISLFAAGVTCVYSEITARIVKIPASVLLLPAIIPLVPGSLLYYAMRGLILGNREEYDFFITEALLTASGIAASALISGALVRAIKILYRYIDKKILRVYNKRI